MPYKRGVCEVTWCIDICHGLLICALSPIVKDPNGDVSSSKNYRSIAISSLILKVFDNCILLLFGQLLSNDALQCSWAVHETISYRLRRGSSVFCCLLDFSKAFNKVNFVKHFWPLFNVKKYKWDKFIFFVAYSAHKTQLWALGSLKSLSWIKTSDTETSEFCKG